MYTLIIVGAGGLGRAMYSVAESDPGHNTAWTLSGFLDTRDKGLLEARLGGLVLGSPLSFKPRPNDIFIPAVGDTILKQQLVEALLKSDAKFIQFAPGTVIGTNSKVGNAVFNRNVYIGTDCVIEDYVFLDQGCIVGHDSHIQEWSHIGVNTFIGGGVTIGKRVIIHGCAQIAAGVTIGDDAIISLGAAVFRDVKPGSTVLGNPAREI
jgi:sugar O-acyltransferase (sialic acid O-acetyltransferase NeuD family)